MDGLVPWLIWLLALGAYLAWVRGRYLSWKRQQRHPVDEQQGLTFADGPTSSVGYDAGHLSQGYRWDQRLALILSGAGPGALVFYFALTGYLSLNLPTHPDVALGYTYPFTIKTHRVYGTYFELMVVAAGPLITWCFAVVTSVIPFSLEIDPNSRAYAIYVFAGAAGWVALYYLIWRACM